MGSRRPNGNVGVGDVAPDFTLTSQSGEEVSLEDFFSRKRAITHALPGGGKKLWVTDELMTFKVSGDNTGGAYSLTDWMVPPQGGPPPHIHHREDEAFWVLEGELEILVGENRFKVVPVLWSTSLKASSTPTRTSAPGTPDS